jgi:hypothetical protein
MSSSKTKNNLPASREGKTMQFEPIPPRVFESLETEAWFRRTLDEQARGRGRKRTDGDVPRGKDVVFEDALRWFLAHFERNPPSHFDEVRPSWRGAAFWVSDDVLERCRVMASRAGVSKRRLMATALLLYCQRLVPDELVKFRHQTFAQARQMYRRHRSAVRTALRAKKVT